MEIKITTQGFIKVKRRNEFKLMICPFSSEESYCGDWCPLFEIYEEERLDEKVDGYIDYRELRLCQRFIQIKSIEYEENNGTNPPISDSNGLDRA